MTSVFCLNLVKCQLKNLVCILWSAVGYSQDLRLFLFALLGFRVVFLSHRWFAEGFAIAHLVCCHSFSFFSSEFFGQGARSGFSSAVVSVPGLNSEPRCLVFFGLWNPAPLSTCVSRLDPAAASPQVFSPAAWLSRSRSSPFAPDFCRWSGFWCCVDSVPAGFDFSLSHRFPAEERRSEIRFPPPCFCLRAAGRYRFHSPPAKSVRFSSVSPSPAGCSSFSEPISRGVGQLRWISFARQFLGLRFPVAHPSCRTRFPNPATRLRRQFVYCT
jgi:hypothetical protein